MNSRSEGLLWNAEVPTSFRDFSDVPDHMQRDASDSVYDLVVLLKLHLDSQIITAVEDRSPVDQLSPWSLVFLFFDSSCTSGPARLIVKSRALVHATANHHPLIAKVSAEVVYSAFWHVTCASDRLISSACRSRNKVLVNWQVASESELKTRVRPNVLIVVRLIVVDVCSNFEIDHLSDFVVVQASDSSEDVHLLMYTDSGRATGRVLFVYANGESRVLVLEVSVIGSVKSSGRVHCYRHCNSYVQRLTEKLLCKYVLGSDVMVTWQTYVRLAFDVADEKGAEFENIEQGGEFMSDLAKLWQAQKEDIKPLTEARARQMLEEVVIP